MRPITVDWIHYAKTFDSVPQEESRSLKGSNKVTFYLYSYSTWPPMNYSISWVNNIGYTNITCFPDDMCLLSGSKVGMGYLIERTVRFLNKRGLQVNADKCMTIGMEKRYKGEKSKVVTKPIFKIKGSEIPLLGHLTNTTKYLGMKFISIGLISAISIKEHTLNTLNLQGY